MEEFKNLKEIIEKNEETLKEYDVYATVSLKELQNLIHKYKEQEEQINLTEKVQQNYKNAFYEKSIENTKLREKIAEQEKVIELMAKGLFEYANLGVLIDCPAEYDGIRDLRNCPRDKNCAKCIIEYFRRKDKGG